MKQQEIEAKYPVNKEYIINGFEDEQHEEKVELISINGIEAFVEYIERPIMHPFRYGKVTVFRLQPIEKTKKL